MAMWFVVELGHVNTADSTNESKGPSKQKIPLRHRQLVGRLADQKLAVRAARVIPANAGIQAGALYVLQQAVDPRLRRVDGRSG